MEDEAAKPSSPCSPCQSIVLARSPLSACKHVPMPSCRRGHGAVDSALGRCTEPCKLEGQGQPPPLLPAPVCKLSKQCKLSPAGLGPGAGSAPAFPPALRDGERRDGGHCAPQGWGSLRGHKGCCTFRSLLSSRINSEPWMSCRTKMSLYSPKPSASSQAATSSEPHLSASREENHRGGLGPREGSQMQQGRQQAAVVAGCSQCLPPPALAGPEATAGSGWRRFSSP